MNKTRYEKIINDYYYKQNKSLEFIHSYIRDLHFDRRITWHRWYELYNFVLNLSDC